MPDWILFLPILFPPIGALLLGLLASRLPMRARGWLTFLFIAIQLIAILLNIAPSSHHATLSDWQLASFALAFQMDGVTILLLVTIFIPLFALWLIVPPRAPFDLLAILVLTAATALIAAQGLLTVYFAWALLDLALFAWRMARDIERETAPRALVVSQVAGLLLFAGAASLSAARTTEGAVLLALAFWARLGLFPFHWVLPTRGADSRDLWLARAIPTLAGLSLWLRWGTLRADAPAEWIITLALLALGAATIWTWREEEPNRAVVVSATHAVALVPMAIAFGGEAGLAFALWLSLGAVIALALFEMALRWRAENRNRWARLIWFGGLFSLAGLPLTPAFLGRVGAYVALWESGQWLPLLVAGAVTPLALAPLWHFGFALAGTEPRDPTRAEYAALEVMTLACAALSLAPMLIAHVLAPNVGEAAERALDRVIRTNDALGVAIGLAILLAPVVGSFFLGRVARDFHPRSGSPILRAARALELNWLERVAASVGYEMSAVARNVSAIAEENPTVWILLVALWIAIFILLPR